MADTGKFYRPELDVLRLFAFLLVFFDHGSPVFHSPLATQFAEAARLGLPLFFMLSSFLISELLIREHERTGTIHLQAFFIRRILRIWPLYLTFLAAIFIAYRFGHGFFPMSALLAFLLFAGNWYSYTHGFLVFAVGILWSISVEEQFYLLWPILMKVGAIRALRLAVPVAFTFAVATLLYSGYAGIAPDRIWFNSFVHFGYFAVGALLALLLHTRIVRPSGMGRLACLGTFILSFFLLAFRFPPVAGEHRIGGLGLLAAYGLMGLGSVALFFCCYGASISKDSPLVYLGRISYGLYVFHLFALQAVEAGMRHLHLSLRVRPFIHLTGALLFTLVLAMLSYRFLEAPFLELKKRFTFVPSREV